jgi:glycosyltransferase involved in cell wall biosynthesis
MDFVKKLPDASIVVISKDRHDLLLRCVDSLRGQEAGEITAEIIVVEEAREPIPIGGVHYVHLPYENRGLAYARNKGVEVARGRVVLFTDDDCLHASDWLREMLLPFDDPEIYGVSGATLAQKVNTVGDCEEILGFPGGGLKRVVKSAGRIVPTQHLSGCNCAYRREVFATQRFDESLIGKLGADDYVLGRNVSMNHRVIFNPAAVVYHLPRGNLRRIVKWFQRRRYCELAIARTEKRLFHRLLLPPWSSMILRTSLLLVLPILFGWEGLAAMALIVILFCLAIELKFLGLIRRKGNWKALLVLPVVKLFMDVGTLWGDLSFLFEKDWPSILNEYRR